MWLYWWLGSVSVSNWQESQSFYNVGSAFKEMLFNCGEYRMTFVVTIDFPLVCLHCTINKREFVWLLFTPTSHSSKYLNYWSPIYQINKHQSKESNVKYSVFCKYEIWMCVCMCVSMCSSKHQQTVCVRPFGLRAGHGNKRLLISLLLCDLDVCACVCYCLSNLVLQPKRLEKKKKRKMVMDGWINGRSFAQRLKVSGNLSLAPQCKKESVKW